MNTSAEEKSVEDNVAGNDTSLSDSTNEEEEITEEEENTFVTPFVDNPADTSTIIDFGPVPSGRETILREGEQELPLDIQKPDDEMEIFQGKDPEKAEVTEEGTL
jgi:hypothetical protein